MAPMGGPVDLNLVALINVLGMYVKKEKLTLTEEIEAFEMVHFAYHVYLREMYPDQFEPLPPEDEDED